MAKQYLAEMEEIVLKKVTEVYDISLGLHTVPRIPKRVSQSNLKSIREGSLYKYGVAIQYFKCKMSWKGAPDVIDPNMLLVMEAEALLFSLKPSSIQHEEAGLEDFP